MSDAPHEATTAIAVRDGQAAAYVYDDGRRVAAWRQGYEPTGVAISVADFSGVQARKSLLATGAFLLAGIQLASDLAMGASCRAHPGFPRNPFTPV